MQWSQSFKAFSKPKYISYVPKHHRKHTMVIALLRWIGIKEQSLFWLQVNFDKWVPSAKCGAQPCAKCGVQPLKYWIKFVKGNNEHKIVFVNGKWDTMWQWSPWNKSHDSGKTMMMTTVAEWVWGQRDFDNICRGVYINHTRWENLHKTIHMYLKP